MFNIDYLQPLNLSNIKNESPNKLKTIYFLWLSAAHMFTLTQTEQLTRKKEICTNK